MNDPVPQEHVETATNIVATLRPFVFSLAAVTTATWASAKFPVWCVGMWRIFHDPRAKARVGDSPHYWQMRADLAFTGLIQRRLLWIIVGFWFAVAAPDMVELIVR